MTSGRRNIDEQIIALFRERSEEAIAQTSSAYGSLLRALALRILGSREDAEEVEQDVYLAAWNQIPPAEPLPLLPWLRTICRRRALDRLEEQTAKKRGGGQREMILEELEESLPAGEDGRHWAERVSLKEAVNVFLKGLPERERNLFLQRYWYFLSIEELARENGLGRNHTKVLLYRIRQKLKAHLEREDLWDG